MQSHDQGYLVALKDIKDLLSMLATEPSKSDAGKTELRAAVHYVNDLILEKKQHLMTVQSLDISRNSQFGPETTCLR